MKEGRGTTGEEQERSKGGSRNAGEEQKRSEAHLLFLPCSREE